LFISKTSSSAPTYKIIVDTLISPNSFHSVPRKRAAMAVASDAGSIGTFPGAQITGNDCNGNFVAQASLLHLYKAQARANSPALMRVGFL
jgi:hypothetical protein